MKIAKELYYSIYTDPKGYESKTQMPEKVLVDSTWSKIEELVVEYLSMVEKSEYWQSRKICKDDWYKDQHLYILYADLFGKDFDGVINRLDVLESQGITLVHILPCMVSPGRDKGFDVSDYMHMQVQLGGNQGFQRLVDACHKRGLSVMIDWVVNHTSDQHAWAKAALSDPHSPQRGFYYFHRGVPTDIYRTYQDKQGREHPLYIVFSDSYPNNNKELDQHGNPRYPGNWALVGYDDDGTPLYVYSTFFHFQWDTNSRNPIMLFEMLRIMLHWRQVGIDAFRLDAIPFWWKLNHTPCVNQPHLFVLLRLIRRINDLIYPRGIFLAEAMSDKDNIRKYLGTPEAPILQMNYDFWLQHDIWYTALAADTRRLNLHLKELSAFVDKNPHAAVILFDESHDELNAENDPELEKKLGKVYGSASGFKEGLAARRMDLLEKDPRRIGLMDILKFALPGVPATYYGNEVGMRSNDCYMEQSRQKEIDHRLEEARKRGESVQREDLAKKIIPDRRDRKRGPVNWRWYEKQMSDQTSAGGKVFALLCKLAQLRKQYVELRRGSLEVLESGNDSVLIINKSVDGDNVLLIQNWSDKLRCIRLPNDFLGKYKNLLTDREMIIEQGQFKIDAYQSLLLKRK